VTKIYISFDMEGMGCITHGNQIPDEGVQDELRRLVTEELNAVITGGVAAGAEAFCVNDAHSSSHNCVPSLLDHRAEYVGGWGQPLTTVQGLDETFDAVFLVGQHSMAGHPVGNLSHTWIPKWLYNLRVNGMTMGEIGLNALLAGHFGVPVALVTGDSAACTEASELLGDIETVTVKHSVGRQSARLMHPDLVRQHLQVSAERAVRRLSDLRAYELQPPFWIELDWATPMFAQLVAMIPGARNSGPRTTVFEGRDVMEIYRFFYTATFMSAAFEDRLY
jgi:D-amino peptidase